MFQNSLGKLYLGSSAYTQLHNCLYEKGPDVMTKVSSAMCS